RACHEDGVKPRIAFVVNGLIGGAADARVVAMASRMASEYDVHILRRGRRKIVSLGAILWRLLLLRPKAVWVVDAAYSGVVATWIAGVVARFDWVIDT